MPITLPRLPYPDDALEPHISRATLRLHHRACVENVRMLAKHVSLADQPLDRILRQIMAKDRIEVWEHAYYLDYRNRRADHVDAIIRQLVNWDFASRNLSRRSALVDAPEPPADRARAS